MNDLERALHGLGRELAVPDAPELVPAVLARLEPRTAPRRPSPLRRRWAVAVAVAVLALLAATLAIPDARSAFLRVFSIGGERIELVDELPEVALQHDLELTLGTRVSLEEARRQSSFGVRELDDPPDRVYLGERGTVWFLYGTPDRVRLLVAQTPLAIVPEDEGVLKKLAAPQTTVERVDVDGAPGLYISGAAHLVYVIDANGEIVDGTPRLARDVLIWDDGGVAYRLEGEFDRQEALDLARELSG